MTPFAFIYDDTYLDAERWTLFSLCVFLPSIVVLSSWLLIRWRKRLAVIAVVIAGIAAWMILSRMNEDMRRWELRRSTRPDAVTDASVEERVAPWVAAVFPFSMIALFFFTSKRPNQSPEPTAMSVTPPAAQEPRQP